MGNLPFVENPHKHILPSEKQKKKTVLKAGVSSPLKARSLALLAGIELSQRSGFFVPAFALNNY